MDSETIVESKLFKLYLNSFINFVVESVKELEKNILQDLSNGTHAKVTGHIFPTNAKVAFGVLSGKSIDDLDIVCNNYGAPGNSLIEYEHVLVEEEITLIYSN